MADAKSKKFVRGHNVLKGKSTTSKPLSKVKEAEKKKAEEAETAAVLDEYIADFQTGAAGGKAFVRAGVINPDKAANQAMISEAGTQYKPKSRLAMQELADEFKKSKAITDDYKSSKDDATKKKSGDKKKSNLELFKEELEMTQKQREIRHKIKKDDFAPQYTGGSHDTGDPLTTNLFVSNLNPKMNEETLCKIFGKYGPLASVKIMWPRSEEEKARNRNCGFVAFMNRKDGEKALDDIEGKDVMDYEMKIGWGKAVPIPPTPIYVHPTQAQRMRPPKQSGLPFNCQVSGKLKNVPFNGNLENCIIKVVIPQERQLLSLINRMVEFVVREGPMFEAMIMNREISNPMFRFLFDNKSNEHTYYRWRIFSVLQGDTPQKWSPGCFYMFVGGSIWQPPVQNPYGAASLSLGAGNQSAAIACVSSANVRNQNNELPKEDEAPSSIRQLVELIQAKKEEKDEEEGEEKPSEKKSLSDRQRDRLEDMLRTVTSDRVKIGELMVWCLDHADCSSEIVECLSESLSILETPIATKVARLHVLSDILHNSSSKVPYASYFRKGFQDVLLEIMDHLHKALASCSTKGQAEKFRKQVLACLAAWQDWSVYPPGFLINLQNIFVGLADTKSVKDPLIPVTGVDGIPFSKGGEDDDLDGVPLDPEIDGIPLSKDDDADAPLAETGAVEPGGLDKKQRSRWETDGGEDPVSRSRWQQGDNDEDEKLDKSKPQRDTSKWTKVESSFADEDKNERSRPDDENSSSPTASRTSTAPEMDEARRKFLRDAELKVMRFVDKLEQRGGSRSGLNIQSEAEKFRQQLIDEYDLARARDMRRRAKSEKKRDRSSSPDGEKKKKKKRRKESPAALVSGSDSESNARGRSPVSERRELGTPKIHGKKSKARSPSPVSSPGRVSRPRSSRRLSRSPGGLSPNSPSPRRSRSPSTSRRSSRTPRRSSRSPISKKYSLSPPSKRQSPHSRIKSNSRSRSPFSDRSLSPHRSLSDRSPLHQPSTSPRRSKLGRSSPLRRADSPDHSSYSPARLSPVREASPSTGSSKKKKKKSRR